MRKVYSIVLLIIFSLSIITPSFSDQKLDLTTEKAVENSVNELTSFKEINLHKPELSNIENNCAASQSNEDEASECANTLEDEQFLDELLQLARDEGLSWEEFLYLAFYPTEEAIDEPVTFEATIKSYDPSKQNIEQEDDLDWDTLLDLLLIDNGIDDIPLDHENIKLLLEDWTTYINYLKQEFFENKESSDEDFQASFFEKLDPEIKASLADIDVFDVKQLVSKGLSDEIDQKLLIDALDQITFLIEADVIANVDKEELLEKYKEAIDDYFSSEGILDELNEAASLNENNMDTANDLPEKNEIHNSNNKPSPDPLSSDLTEKQNELNYKVSSCSDFNDDPMTCTKISRCKYDGGDTTSMCAISPDHMNYLVNTGCKAESKANILSVARDLLNEGYIDEAKLSHLKSLQNNDEICRFVTHAYFSSAQNQGNTAF